MKCRRVLTTLFTFGFALAAIPAFAQSPINPAGVTFTASVDHSATIAGSTPPIPIVDHYELQTYRVDTAGNVLVFTAQLGKPTPTGTTIAATVGQFSTLANGIYNAKVLAVGPGGSGVSTPSLPFGHVGPPAAPGQPTITPAP